MGRAAVLFILGVFTASQLAGAASGLGAGTGNWRSPKDTKGLCTPNNKDEVYYKSGYCKSVYESFVKDGCVKDKLEELRLRFLQDERQSGFSKLKNKDAVSLFECNSRPGARPASLYDLAKDPKQFAFVMMQFVSLVVIEESDWDIKNNGNGLMNLKKQQMDDKKYACGCDIANSESRGGDITGPSPGPTDGHHSIQCGAYMAIHHALQDGVLYGGYKRPGAPQPPQRKGDEPNDGRQGAARIFKSLESSSDNGQTMSSSMKLINEKMTNFCQRYAHSKTNTWERELTDDIGIPDANR